MTLEEYLKEMRNKLVAFEMYWKGHHETEPEDWPLEMDGRADWNEHFEFFNY